MRATFEARREGDVLVLDICGRLTLGEPVTRFQEIVVGERKVVLNLRGLEYLDSAGLGEVIRRNREATMRLVNVPKRVRDLLLLTGTEGLFNIQPDEQSAVTSLL